MTNRYRADVDGLRAVAIIPVVLFHGGLSYVSGGFVGVDVFFVVSGFLITGLIHHEIRTGTFSVLAFYERRIRRIFPALFTVIAAAAVAAPLILLSDDLIRFGRSVVATAGFASNFLFWSEDSYFAAGAEGKPLLHTWSLAVEEQFYIFFPMLLLVMRRLPAAGEKALLAALLAASLISSALAMRMAPSAVFYLAPFRAWELLLGALLAIGAIPPLRGRIMPELATLTGLLLILWSVFAISPQSAFPWPAAVAPCLGAALILHADSVQRGTAINRLLASRLMVSVGLISYPLYLWHWPLLVFARRWKGSELDVAQTGAILALAFVLATLSYRFIEQPIRRGKGMDRRTLRSSAALAMSLSIAFGLGVQSLPLNRHADFVAQHIRGREDYRVATCFMDEGQRYAEWSASACLTDHHSERTVLLWGDSFAAHYIAGLADDLSARKFNVVQYTAYSCPPVLTANVAWAPNCREFNDHVSDVLDRFHFDTVVLAARWERYWGHAVDRERLQRTLKFLKARHLMVVLVAQGPSFQFDDPAKFAYRNPGQAAEARPSSRINRDLHDLTGYDVYFDPNDYLCDAGRCAVIRDGQFLYWDSGHYSTYGSRLVSEPLARAIDHAAPRAAARGD